MTKSTITREWLQQTIAELESVRDEIPFGIDTNSELELAAFRLALAAMDSEPVAWRVSFTQIGHESNNFTKTYWDEEEKDRWVKLHKMSGYKVVVEPLYRHAQPVVSADLLHTAASAIEDLLTTKDRTGAGAWFDLPFRLRSAANGQPAPVVPEEMTPQQASRSYGGEVRGYRDGWNACRAAMLQAGYSPVIPDGWKLVPIDATRSMIDAARRVEEDGYDAMHKAMLAAAPQEKPVNVVTAGKALTITLPDISSKAFWSGAGKNETFHPETYRRWVKEAVERACVIASIDAEVK